MATASEYSFLGDSIRSQDFEDKPWRCGEPYHFPVDDTDSKDADPWKKLIDHFYTKEQVRCDAWKDEVQHLLVFSGLFSAVVTAFLVESYKTLQQDPTDLTVLLLTRIASGSNASPTLPAFKPAPTSLRVNVFWFLSLVFSLATALVGIVALQWVRAHMRPLPQGLSLRRAAPLLHMNAEALDRFYVPHIFTALPVLLLTGLVLFLVGLIDFLWHLNHTVAAPVLVAVTLTLLFLLTSTVLPALQPLPLRPSTRKEGTAPRAPCPYKSPQSWAFLRFISFFQRLFSQPQPEIIKSKTDWLDHSLLFLRQRDIDFLASKRDPYHLIPAFCRLENRFSPVYDTLHALINVKDSLSVSKRSELVGLYRAFNEFTSFSYGKEGRYQKDLVQVVDDVFPRPRLSSPEAKGNIDRITLPRSLILSNEGAYDVLVDNLRLRFTTQHTTPNDKFRLRRMTRQHLEIAVRLTYWLFAEGPRSLAGKDGEGKEDVGTLLPPVVLVEGYFMNQSVEEPLRLDIAKQILDILDAFFTHAASYVLPPPPPPRGQPPLPPTTHTSAYTSKFLLSCARIVARCAEAIAADPGLTALHDSILSGTAGTLREAVREASLAPGAQTPAQGPTAPAAERDYLFLVAAVYVEGLLRSPFFSSSASPHPSSPLQPPSPPSPSSPASPAAPPAPLADLIGALRAYKPGFHRRKEGQSRVGWALQGVLVQRGFWGFLVRRGGTGSVTVNASTMRVRMAGTGASAGAGAGVSASAPGSRRSTMGTSTERGWSLDAGVRGRDAGRGSGSGSARSGTGQAPSVPGLSGSKVMSPVGVIYAEPVAGTTTSPTPVTHQEAHHAQDDRRGEVPVHDQVPSAGPPGEELEDADYGAEISALLGEVEEDGLGDEQTSRPSAGATGEVRIDIDIDI